MFETSEKKFKNFSPKIYYIARERQLGFYVWSLNIRFHGFDNNKTTKLTTRAGKAKRIGWKAVGINSFPRWIIYIIPSGILLPPLQVLFRAFAWKKSHYVFIFPCNFIYNGELRLIKKLYGTSGEERRWMPDDKTNRNEESKRNCDEEPSVRWRN